MSGEKETLTLTTRHGYAPVTYEQDENGAIHQITLHLPPGAAWAGPDGAPVVARDEAAELRAALAEGVALLKESLTPSTDVRSAMSRAKRQRRWFAATRRILAASEGQS